ncbi:MAG: protein kinase [Acidimicrobiia bacterium]|nr:protein kinase [Acidimicrobiia bacterium]
MVDEADKPTKADADSSPTPHASGRPEPPYDRTIKLDRSIVERDPTVPVRFGRYEVIGRIGIGGFASVFSARDPELDAPVAIKVLAENHSADIEVRKRFVAEARVARRLGSDRLIGVFDLGETDDGRPFVVMELASGGTLRARLTRTGRPSRDALLRLIDELGSCMIAIHAKDVVHRDIKPSNLLIRPVGPQRDEHPTELIAADERLVLADFGLARDISDGASAVTVGGGTAGYMAPEQADPNGRADFRADIYAATVVVAELTTGRHPERLDLATADLAPSVLEALEEGLAVHRERRPPSAVAWRDRLLAAFREDAPTRLGDGRDRGGGTGDRDRSDDNGAPASDRTVAISTTKIEAPYPYINESDEYDLTSFDQAIDHLDAEPDSGLDPTEVYPLDDGIDARLGGSAGIPVDDGPPPPPPSIPLNPRVQPPPPGQEPVPQPGSAGRIGSSGTQPGPRPPTRPGETPAEHRGQGARPGPAREIRPAAAGGGAQPSVATPGPPGSGQSGVGQHAPTRSAAGHYPPNQPPAAGHYPANQQPIAGHYPANQQPAAGHYPANQQPIAGQHPVDQSMVPPPPVAAAPQTLSGPSQAVARHQPPSAEHRQPPPPGPIPGGQQGPGPGQQGGPPSVQRGRAAVRAERTVPSPGGPPVPVRQAGGLVPQRAGAAVVEPRSRRQTKLQAKTIRKDVRRRKRRRRRRRISNVFRAVIRGILAALLTALVATIVAAAATNSAAGELPPRAEVLVNLSMFAAFFIGLQVFPWPRRLDPDG